MTRVVLVGAGALGSHLVLFGRNLPAQWTVVDFDRVEHKNVLAQLHARTTVGRNKAQALQQAMQGLFGVRIDAIPHRLVADNVEALLGPAGVVVDCVDDAPTRRLIQEFAVARGVPCLHGALAADGTFARVAWTEVFTPDEGAPGAPTCEGGEHLPFIGYVAARLAGSLQAFLERGEKRSAHLLPDRIVAL